MRIIYYCKMVPTTSLWQCTWCFRIRNLIYEQLKTISPYCCYRENPEMWSPVCQTGNRAWDNCARLWDGEKCETRTSTGWMSCKKPKYNYKFYLITFMIRKFSSCPLYGIIRAKNPIWTHWRRICSVPAGFPANRTPVVGTAAAVWCVWTGNRKRPALVYKALRVLGMDVEKLRNLEFIRRCTIISTGYISLWTIILKLCDVIWVTSLKLFTFFDKHFCFS